MKSGEYEINYFHVNYNNKMKVFTEREVTESLTSLFTSIVNEEDDKVGNEINKYFNKLIPKNDSDLLIINELMCEKYLKNYSISEKDIIQNMNKILNSNYSKVCIFNRENIYCLSTIIVWSYKRLFSKEFSSKLSKHKIKIKKFSQILQLVDGIKMNNIDMIRYFINRNKYQSIISMKKKKKKDLKNDDFSCLFNNPNNYLSVCQFNTTKNESSAYDSQSDSIHDNYYTYPIPYTPFEDLQLLLPIEMILLINKFQTVKTLTFTLNDINEKSQTEILIILLNLRWLFDHILKVNYEISNETVQESLNHIYEYKLSKVLKQSQFLIRRSKYDSNFSGAKSNLNRSSLLNLDARTSYSVCLDDNYDNISTISECERNNVFFSYFRESENGKLIEDQEYLGNNQNRRDIANELKSITEFIRKYFYFFDGIIIYSYFLGHISDLKELNIIFQDSFSEEIKRLVLLSKITLINFSFLNFIKHEKLENFSIAFNCLENNTFNKVLRIINRNSELGNLSISFFTPECNYSASSLYKLCISSQMNLTNILTKHFYDEKNNNSFENREIDEIFMLKFLDSFQINLEKLFLLVKCKQNLKEILFYFDIPSILTHNDFYTLVILKFIINILIFVYLDLNSIRSLSLIAPYLRLDNRKFPFADKLLAEFNNYRVELKTLDFEIQMYRIPNIKYLATKSLQKLNIGFLDCTTFNSFIDYITTDDFVSGSNLNSIKIGLNISVIEYDDVQNSLMKLFNAKFKYLFELTIKSSLTFSDQQKLENFIYVVTEKSNIKNILIEINHKNDQNFKNIQDKYNNNFVKKMVTICYCFCANNKLKRSSKKSFNNIMNNIKFYLYKPLNRFFILDSH